MSTLQTEMSKDQRHPGPLELNSIVLDSVLIKFIEEHLLYLLPTKV